MLLKIQCELQCAGWQSQLKCCHPQDTNQTSLKKHAKCRSCENWCFKKEKKELFTLLSLYSSYSCLEHSKVHLLKQLSFTTNNCFNHVNIHSWSEARHKSIRQFHYYLSNMCVMRRRVTSKQRTMLWPCYFSFVLLLSHWRISKQVWLKIVFETCMWLIRWFLTSTPKCAWPSSGLDSGTAKTVRTLLDSFYGQALGGKYQVWYEGGGDLPNVWRMCF